MDLVFWKSFFLYGFLGHMLIVLYWFFMVTFLRDFVFRWHSKIFKISEDKLLVIHYCGMAGFKLVGISLFLIPYICLEILV